MTAYCTVSDIEDRFKALTISTTSAVNTTKAQALIDQYSAFIDARISKVYSVPVSGIEALKVLKLVCVSFVVAELEPIVSQAVGEKKGREDTMFKSAREMLSDIESGRLELTDATLRSTDSVSSGNVAGGVCPVFKKDRTQW